MASADPRDCSVCLKRCAATTVMSCGHILCIDCLIGTDKEPGGFFCPKCEGEKKECRRLLMNLDQRSSEQNLPFPQPEKEETRVRCTYCLDVTRPAVKSCRLCEAHLCDQHLTVHSKAPEHVLCDPNTSLKTRKCSVHRDKILKYYCTEDTTSICVSCRLDGDHQGHQVETLDEAFENKKKKLGQFLQKIVEETWKIEIRVQNLQKRKSEVEEKAAGETERVTDLFRVFRRRMEDLEKKVLRDITEQMMEISGKYNEVIRQLEIKKEELSRKMRHIEELCHMTDALTEYRYPQASPHSNASETQPNLQPTPTAQDTHSNMEDNLYFSTECSQPIPAEHHPLQQGGPDTETVQQTSMETGLRGLLLDVNTASRELLISHDGKTASKVKRKQKRPDTADIFQDSPQVLSSRSFSSGRHYWEADVGRSRSWIVGMCYPSIDRSGDEADIGNNDKSWGLERSRNQYTMVNDEEVITLPDKISSDRVRIDLDYEAGQISFYDMSDPIRHLHTFTATFTEPLHAALLVAHGSIKISGEAEEM
ncbi:E3 ubiquitin-protein ligase TRIM7-like [Hyperolius riggenbachi]|uniref:E3 ubiquitin-protein ligase TRIM7-like n=1 Tax=Hyperolius riggenbachi TaxID=752182 RepID=UPI0035A32593